jgi:pimeloyl-ACP methyl ester carboxylesterase
MKLRINFKAVVVILFGIFCLYAYFRLIGPYLDVGGNSTLVSSTIFSRKTVYVKGERYSYWTNGVLYPRKVVVMLPPSTATGDYFGKYVEKLPKNVLVIAPDYPGRGLTDGLKSFDTIPLMSYRVGILLKQLIGNRNFDIVAPSFGGMIGTALVKDKDLRIDKIFLIATGEFFAPDQKFMYKVLINPARTSEKIRAKYVDILTSGNVFNNLQSTNIGDMLEQLITTIDYKIDTSRVLDTPAIIITFNKDNVVQAGSSAKLEQVFINSNVINLDLTHTSPSFFNQDVLDIVKNNL